MLKVQNLEAGQNLLFIYYNYSRYYWYQFPSFFSFFPKKKLEKRTHLRQPRWSKRTILVVEMVVCSLKNVCRPDLISASRSLSAAILKQNDFCEFALLFSHKIIYTKQLDTIYQCEYLDNELDCPVCVVVLVILDLGRRLLRAGHQGLQELLVVVRPRSREFYDEEKHCHNLSIDERCLQY